MDGQEKLLNYETIKAAVTDERWTMEKVLAYYVDYTNELSAVEIRQTNDKKKKVIDEGIRQRISLKLLEALSNFPLEQKQTAGELYPLAPLCGHHLHTPEIGTPAARLYLSQGSNYNYNLRT